MTVVDLKMNPARASDTEVRLPTLSSIEAVLISNYVDKG